MTKDLVDDRCERTGRIDHHTRSGDVLLGSVESEYDIAFGRFRAPLALRALVEPPTQGVKIDIEDEDLVEQIDELPEVARASAKEADRLLMVDYQRPYATHVPNVVLVHSVIQRLARHGIALVRKLPVTVDGLVTTSVELYAHRRLPRTGDTLDEIVTHTHRGQYRPATSQSQRR